MTLPDVLRRVVSILNEESVAYMVTGSFATAFYAHPRATQNIDLVVEPAEDALERVAARLKEAGFYVSPEAVREAVEHVGQFNAIEPDTGWKIDFIVRKSRPFSIAEFSRRTRAEVLGLELSLATAEDLVIAKLEWAKLGGSEIQLRDVQKILRTRWSELDRPYLKQWIAELGLDDLWNRVTEAIDFDPGDSA